MTIQNLRIPGPTPVPPTVMQAMQRAMIPHRGDDFRELHRGLISKLQTILGTTGDVYVIPGSGSVGWEAAIVNTLGPGDEVLAFIIGDFGVRFAAVAEQFGLKVHRIVVESGKAARPDLVRDELQRHPEAKAVLYTHNETSTGVTNPLDRVGPIVRDHGALLFVDAVSSAGAIPIESDRWGIDVLLTGSQKGWMCPPGLAMVSVSERSLERGESARFPRAFLDFQSWHSSIAKGDTPATAPLTHYFALDAACDLILDEGIDARAERHHSVARITRQSLADSGFEQFAEEDVASSTVTAARPPGTIGAKDLVNQVRERYDIDVAAGQADLSDEIIRIGHMGWFEPEDIARAVDAVVACTTVTAE
ncbi:MAG: alanine--glyoxylate aminotransferase family protein [Thermomicrobiaceae bacterium]